MFVAMTAIHKTPKIQHQNSYNRTLDIQQHLDEANVKYTKS